MSECTCKSLEGPAFCLLHGEPVYRRPAEPQGDAPIQHEWGCAAWSSGDDSECDEICGATSRAKGNGEGKPGASTSLPAPSDPYAKLEALASHADNCALMKGSYFAEALRVAIAELRAGEGR